jgi:D-alanyl-D-alanine carboxypeptidase
LFQFGSNTKSFTASIILQLEAEGKLKITDPISKYIDFTAAGFSNEWKDITIRQLMNMTSGIFNYTEDPDFSPAVFGNPDRVWLPTDLIKFAAGHHNYFKPGENWHYSNTNYVILGMIIESVTGNSYTSEINTRILGPTNFNLLNTYFDNVYSDDVMSHVAHGYLDTGSGKIKDMFHLNASWAWTAGAIVANTRDFARWPRLLFEQRYVVPYQQLTEMQSLVCMSAEQHSTPGEEVERNADGGYGLGVGEVHLDRYGYLWGHGGGTLGYLTEFKFVESYNTSIAIATNLVSGDNDVSSLLAQILEILYATPEWQNYRAAHNIPYVANANQKEVTQKLQRFTKAIMDENS